MNIHGVFPTPAHLDHSHFHPRQINQGGYLHVRPNRATWVLYTSQILHPSEEGDLDRSIAARYKRLQIIPLSMHPERLIVLVETSKERQARLQMVGVEPR